LSFPTRRSSDLSIGYRLSSAEELVSCNFPEPFDLVFAVDVLEHVDDRDRTLAGIAQVLAPGGGLGFLTHNRTIAAFLQVIWDEEYVHHTMPEGFHDFARFITPGELAEFTGADGVEDALLRTYSVADVRPLAPGAVAFLDGIEQWRVVGYGGVTPIVRGYVAAAVRRRGPDRRLRTAGEASRELAIT